MSAAKKSKSMQWWHVDVAGVLACAVLTFVGYLVIVKPIAVEREELITLRSHLEQKEAQRQLAETRRKSIGDELGRAQARLDGIPVRLESVDFLNRRLAVIVEIAASSGLAIHETRSGEFEEGLRYSSVPLSLNGSGRFTECGAFLHAIYEELPDVEVTGFNFNGRPGQPGSPLTFTFSLAWYAAPSMATASPTPSTAP